MPPRPQPSIDGTGDYRCKLNQLMHNTVVETVVDRRQLLQMSFTVLHPTVNSVAALLAPGGRTAQALQASPGPLANSLLGHNGGRLEERGLIFTRCLGLIQRLVRLLIDF